MEYNYNVIILSTASTAHIIIVITYLVHFPRFKLKRMITDPRPETIFPGGRSRVYRRHEITGQWILEQCEDQGSLWAGSDLRMQFN